MSLSLQKSISRYTVYTVVAVKKFAGPCPGRVRSRAFGKGKETKTSTMTKLFFFQNSSKNEHFSRNGFRNYQFQEKDSKMDSETSRCCCFLLRLLFLVQKTHARLPLREPPGIGIGSCLSLAGHLFLKHFLKHKKWPTDPQNGFKMVPKSLK